MRVAIYHNLPPGGALRVLRDYLARRPDDVVCDVFTLDARAADETGDPSFEARDLSAWADRQHREPIPFTGGARLAGSRLGRYLLVWGVRRAQRRVAAQINAGAYDVAYVHGCWISQTPAILGDLDAPSVYYMQEVRRATFEPGLNTRPPRPAGRLATLRWWLSERLETVLRRRDVAAAAAPDIVLCNSRFSADSIRSAYGRQARLAYLGVDTDVFEGSPSAERSRRVVSVGTMDPVKGHHVVVEALGLLSPDERPSLAVVYERLVEDYRAEVLALAAARGVEVSEHRGVSDSGLAELYAGSTAVMVAARNEPFGLVPIEAMACGTPVVATRTGGYVETVDDGVSGVLVDPDPAALAEGYRRLVSLGDRISSEHLRAIAVERWSLQAAVSRQHQALVDAAAGTREP